MSIKPVDPRSTDGLSQGSLPVVALSRNAERYAQDRPREERGLNLDRVLNLDQCPPLRRDPSDRSILVSQRDKQNPAFRLQGERLMSVASARTGHSNRWVQLVLGIICMASVANLQYGWTLFVLPIQHQWGWSKAEIQVAFSIFILLQTWLVPFEGAIVDRIGPRWMVRAGGIATFLAWFINSQASSLGMLYLGGAVAGFAGGAVYGTCVGNALKWFPDKRGLCAGLTAAGFGAGAAITIAPIRSMIL